MALDSKATPTPKNRLRGLSPLAIRSAVSVSTSWRRAFIGARGMAGLIHMEKEQGAGHALHSVAYCLSEDDMRVMDAIEVGYDRVPIKLRLLPRVGANRRGKVGGAGGGEDEVVTACAYAMNERVPHLLRPAPHKHTLSDTLFLCKHAHASARTPKYTQRLRTVGVEEHPPSKR